jgi:hypothetical protein
VAQLVLEVIALRPSALLMPDAAAATLGDGDDGPLLPARDAVALLRSVLDLGVTIPPARELRARVLDLRSRPTEDALEELFEQLRPKHVEIEVSPDAHAALTGGAAEDRIAAADDRVPEDVRTAIAVAYGYQLEELGLRLRLVFVRVARFERPRDPSQAQRPHESVDPDPGRRRDRRHDLPDSPGGAWRGRSSARRPGDGARERGGAGRGRG